MESARPSLLAAETSTLLWAFAVIFLIFSQNSAWLVPYLLVRAAAPRVLGLGGGEAPHGDTSVLHAPGAVLPAQAVLVEMVGYQQKLVNGTFFVPQISILRLSSATTATFLQALCTFPALLHLQPGFGSVFPA